MASKTKKKEKEKNPKTIKVVSSLDVAVQNAWQLHRLHGGKLDYFTFRRQIVLALLQTNKSSRKRGRPSSLENIISRFDNASCYTVPQREAEFATKKCAKCNVALNMDCFVTYHKKL
jgi:hypothetical protein